MRLSASHLTRNLEDQALVFMSPEDSVAQLHLQAPGSSGTSGLPIPVPI
jgi:hypothetical protein